MQCRFPQAGEEACALPLLKPSVRGGTRTETRGIERLPLTAGAQHEKDAVQHLTVRNARAVAAQRMHFLLTHGYQRLDQLPQHIRNLKLLHRDRFLHNNQFITLFG